MNKKYEVLGIVGEGAYGIVYKCKNKDTGEFVAIKKFKETEDDVVKKSMQRELKVLKIIKHENIVEFKEAFQRKGCLFLVFEYVEKNLLEVLQEHPKGLDPNCIKKLIYQMCKAIKYLNENNIIHRDIKPENMLIDSNYNLKLCDFGFAKVVNKNARDLTDYVATRWYRPPELLLISSSYTAEVDYWAVGCIMGELSDGDPLFPGENELDQLVIIQNMIGKLPDFQLEAFSKVSHFKGKKLIEPKKPTTLDRRYLGKLPKLAISFLKGLLNPDPSKRLNSDTVFNHPYFENLEEAKKTKLSEDRNYKLIMSERSSSNNKLDEILKKQEDILAQTKVNFKSINNQFMSNNNLQPNITNINIFNLIEKEKSPEKKDLNTTSSNLSMIKTTNIFSYDKLGTVDKSKSFNNINNELFKVKKNIGDITKNGFGMGTYYLLKDTNKNQQKNQDASPIHSIQSFSKDKKLNPLKGTFTKTNFYKNNLNINNISKSIKKLSEKDDFKSNVSFNVKALIEQKNKKNNFNNIIAEESEFSEANNNTIRKPNINLSVNQKILKNGNKNFQLPNITKNFFFK